MGTTSEDQKYVVHFYAPGEGIVIYADGEFAESELEMSNHVGDQALMIECDNQTGLKVWEGDIYHDPGGHKPAGYVTDPTFEFNGEWRNPTPQEISQVIDIEA
jgi:hypothetical protein